VVPALPLTAPRLSLNRSVSARRIVSFTGLPFDDVRRVRKTLGVTVNDVVASVTAGAFRRYLDDRGELPDRPLIAAIPTSERLPEHGPAGNRFSTMFYALPVDEPDPLERLRRSAESAAAAKQLYERVGRRLLEDLACLAPPGVAGPVVRAGQRMRLVEHKESPWGSRSPATATTSPSVSSRVPKRAPTSTPSSPASPRSSSTSWPRASVSTETVTATDPSGSDHDRRRRTRRRRVVRRLLAAVGVVTVVTALTWAGLSAGAFAGFQRRTGDALQPGATADDRVVVVGIDRASIDELVVGESGEEGSGT